MCKTYLDLHYSCEAIKERFISLYNVDAFLSLGTNRPDLEDQGHGLYVPTEIAIHFLAELSCYFGVSLKREYRDYYGHIAPDTDEVLTVYLYAHEDLEVALQVNSVLKQGGRVLLLTPESDVPQEITLTEEV